MNASLNLCVCVCVVSVGVCMCVCVCVLVHTTLCGLSYPLYFDNSLLAGLNSNSDYNRQVALHVDGVLVVYVVARRQFPVYYKLQMYGRGTD